MLGLLDAPGRCRRGGAGIYHGEQLVHMAPPANQVPRLMANLLNWLAGAELPPLVASCLFHYEFEFIHPFADGNGRLGRLWQTLILAKWRPELAWLPLEEVVRDQQQDYYDALGEADRLADATPFVEFMLAALEQALVRAIARDDGASDGVTEGVPVKLDACDHQILRIIRQQPHVTHEALAKATGRSLSTIQRRIRKLRKHHIERIGSD